MTALPPPMRRIKFLSSFIALTLALHFYIGIRLIPAMHLNESGVSIGIGALALLYVSLFLGVMGRFIKAPKLADPLVWVGMLALGVPFFALLLTLFGFVNARSRARVVTVNVPIAGLPVELEGFTIAQISDLHVGPTIKHNRKLR